MITIETILRKIANTLFINVQNMELYGLLRGKLGVALFFYHYARYSHQPSYSEFAEEYIDFVCDHLSMKSPKDFGNGLTGHAWTIHHVIESHFVDAEEDFLEEIDLIIGEMDVSSLLMELNDEIPLFSKGIYFTARKKDTYIKETLFQCEELLEQKEMVYPMSYLNSMLYFLMKAYHSDIEAALCVKLCDALIERIKPAIEFKMYTDTDMVTLRETIHHLKRITGIRNGCMLVKDMDIRHESIMRSCWSSLIYGYNNLRGIKIEEINTYVDKTIRDLREQDIPFYNGLTGLGFELMMTFKNWGLINDG